MAYNISNSNRGYIFLISAAKFIFLAITAAFSINYSANYMAQLSLLRTTSSEDGPLTSGQIYGVFLSWVIVMGSLIYFFYYRLSNNQKWNSLVWFAYIFGGCFILQFVVVLVTMIFAASHSEDQVKDSMLYK